MSAGLEKTWADVLAAVHGHHKGLVDEGHVDPERLRLTVAARKEAVVQLRVKGLSERQIAATLGIPKSTVHDGLPETGQKPPETGQAIEVSEKDILAAAKGIREGRAKEIRAKNEELSKSPILAPYGKFETIVIDPPWPMKKIGLDARPDSSVEIDYPTMTEAELRTFAPNITAIASDDCHIFMWTTQKYLPLAMELVDLYGFRYVFAMVWHKPGGFQPFGLPQFNCEFVIYGRRGTPKFIDTKTFPCCFSAPRHEHSRKPDEFYHVIRRVTGGPRIDVFSREPREGFVQYGNETNKFEAPQELEAP